MSNETTNRFDRIVAIFIHLQSRRVVKAQELADRFQVSLRTIYRDIRSLEISGVPIVGEAGIGYSIMEGNRLPSVKVKRKVFNRFGSAEKPVQKFSDKAIGDYHRSAIYKVKSVLRGVARDQATALESQVWVNA